MARDGCGAVIVVSDDDDSDIAKESFNDKGQVDIETISDSSSSSSAFEISDDEGYEERRSDFTASSQISVVEEQHVIINEPIESCDRKRKASPWRMRLFNKLVRNKKLIYPFKDLLLLSKMLQQYPIIWKSQHEVRVKYNRAMIEFAAVYNAKCTIFKFKADLSYFIEGLKQAYNAELTALCTQPNVSQCALMMSFRCECAICQAFQFLDIKSVVEHQRQHVDQLESVYHCKKCMQFFGFQKLIVNYVQQSLEHGKSVGNVAAISSKPKLQCTQCAHCFFRKEMLKAHMFFAHGTQFNQNMHYKCSECGLISSTFLKCLLHVRRQHVFREFMPQYRCFMCGQCFWKKANRRRHFQARHLMRTKFECKPCKRSYQLVWNLWRHKQRSHKNPRICFICGGLNYNSSLCATHTLAEHEFYIEKRKDSYTKPIQLLAPKDYECSYCTRCYPQQKLARHMQLHLTGRLRM